MALNPIQLKQKQSGGKGGLFGKIAGTVLGGAAGFLAGGPAGAVGGAKLGGSLGGAVGSVADPAKSKGGRGVPLSKVAERDPEVQLAQLVDAQKDLLKSTQVPQNEKDETMNNILLPAIQALKKNLEVR